MPLGAVPEVGWTGAAERAAVAKEEEAKVAAGKAAAGRAVERHTARRHLGSESQLLLAIRPL